ncbi:E3 ubiquitin-protein ligase NEDD4-like [Mobula hypostoma]|uniref:E3 ubiquitin-protein ligase NEDD4-like n=1 Tax=Mobula hypostoma TaxID=723540 RepID=UPI002FC33F51
MARHLRLHFATRRSNTDPLSEASGESLESNICMTVETLSRKNVNQLTTPEPVVMPTVSQAECILQRSSSLFIPQVSNNDQLRRKSSTLQISLQSKQSSRHGESGNSVSCERALCSTNIPFHQQLLDHTVVPAKTSAKLRKSKVPLRRCSSLVIFPQSPCNTPPATLTSPDPFAGRSGNSTLSRFLPCSQEPIQSEDRIVSKSKEASTCCVATAVNGLRLSNPTYSSEVRDIKPLYCNGHQSGKSRALDCGEEDSECQGKVKKLHRPLNHILHLNCQKALVLGTETKEGQIYHESFVKEFKQSSLNTGCTRYQDIKLIRSTSVCLPSFKHSECQINDNGVIEGENVHGQSRRPIFQRSHSLEVPCQMVSSNHLRLRHYCSKVVNPQLQIHVAPRPEHKIFVSEEKITGSCNKEPNANVWGQEYKVS